MRRSRIALAVPKIIDFFEQQPQKVFSLPQLQEILSSQRESWQLANGMNVNAFVSYLTSETKLLEHRLEFSFRPITRYSWGAPSFYEFLMSLRPSGYLSHYSAMQYHGLVLETEAQPVYLNDEQEPKSQGSGRLEQSRIDAAFQRPARVTNNRAAWGSRTIFLVNGMNTSQLGVIEDKHQAPPTTIRVTSLERTLIDITVRPTYSGGPEAVLAAYKAASGKVSTKRILSMLKKLSYKYPYHQAIGFYLERCGGYDEVSIQPFRKLPKKYDFYLAHHMKDPLYSDNWRIYYPSSL